jgi:hypothetical protein
MDGAGYGVVLGGGTMTVEGDLSGYVYDTHVGVVMVDPRDVLRVGGDVLFTEETSQRGSSDGRLTAGVWYVGGDLTQQFGLFTGGTALVLTGTRVVMNGTTAQRINLTSSGASLSYFDDLDVENPAGVTVISNTLVRGDVRLRGGRLVVNSARTLTVQGAVEVGATSTLDVRGTLTYGACSVAAGATILGSFVCP